MCTQRTRVYTRVHVTRRVEADESEAVEHELDALSLEERVIYGSTTRMIFRSYFNAHTLLRDGLISEDQWRTLLPSIEREATRRAFPGWWKLGRAAFPEDFSSVVERAMAAESSDYR